MQGYLDRKTVPAKGFTMYAERFVLADKDGKLVTGKLFPTLNAASAHAFDEGYGEDVLIHGLTMECKVTDVEVR